MQKQNELNDIILNKNAKNNSVKKVLLTIATFAITLIVVVVIMNQISGKRESSLPHAPKKSAVVVEEVVQEPEVEVIEEVVESTTSVVEEEVVVEEVQVTEPEADVAATVPDGKDETDRIFEEVFEEPDYTTTTQQKSVSKTVAPKPVQKAETKQVLKPKIVRPSGKYDPKSKSVVKAEGPVAAESGRYYIQVGSFATYKPSKAFLKKIADRGYTYTYHKITRSGKTLNKVLVGPFKTKAAAREALPVIKRSVEAGAFLTKI
ncbi:MAG: SPOR domain-containing protein [Campylobacterota bacterium]